VEPEAVFLAQPLQDVEQAEGVWASGDADDDPVARG
jgi:hypothetical protein